MTQEYSIDEKLIYVIDNALSPEECKSLHRTLLSASYSPLGSSSNASASYDEIMCKFDSKDIKSTKLYNRIFSKISENHKNLKLVELMGNMSIFGDTTFIHRDSPSENIASVLVFGNSDWIEDYGGEIIFYDASNESELAILPLPGRIIIFNATLKHRAGLPSRNSNAVRISLSLRYATPVALTSKSR